MLAHFDLQSPTFVTCDASNTAICAVLSQLQGGTERPVAFASRSLTPTEQKYSVVEREALSCIWACEQWHMYLYGRHFTLQTDSQALTALLATSVNHHLSTTMSGTTFPAGTMTACAVVPSALQGRILTMVHKDHLGVVRVKQCCRGLVWWPGIDRDIEAMVKDCADCLTSGKMGPTPLPPLQPLPWPAAPWSHIQVDIFGELNGIPQHQRFLLVAYALHSKWPQVRPVGSVTTQVVTDFLSSLFACWGVPDTITTDNGPKFISADFASFAEKRGITHVRTALYHPQANGGVERFNQTLKNGLRAHLADNLPFPAALQNTLLHYRATPHATTGCSPALLMLGREL